MTDTLIEILKVRLTGNRIDARRLSAQPISGGSINKAYRLSLGKERFFCKVNSATNFPHLFREETAGLTLLAKQEILKTPTVIDCFEKAGHQFLVLQWIQPGEHSRRFWDSFGEQLAALHRVSTDSFGLPQNNYMGSVPQNNTPAADWVSFFREQRLLPMIKRCIDKQLLPAQQVELFNHLFKKLPSVFNEEKPSLLHGDLWSGNFMCDEQGNPVLIDPAVYFGHRSMDLALTTLFGGFSPRFYEAYHYHSPLPSNFKEQWAVCNLYPLLIHLYLFGAGYLGQIRHTLHQFS